MAIAVMPRTKLRGTWKECGADQEVLMQQIASPEPKRERGSQAAHVLLGGEGFPSGKLSGDVRKGERETSQVVLRQSWPHGELELALEPVPVKVWTQQGDPALDLALRGAQVHAIEALDDGVEIGVSRSRSEWRDQLKLPFPVDEEVKIPEAHVGAWDPAHVTRSHLKPARNRSVTRKPLPGAPTVGVSYHDQRVNHKARH